MKKWLLCILSLFFMITFVGLKGSDVMYSYDGLGSYQELYKQTEQEIAYQVMHQKIFGQTATQLHQTPSGGSKNEAGLGSTGVLLPNVFYDQQINILSGKTNEQVKVVSWGFTSNTRYQMRTITALARDYEEKNPGWKVIGGINADFYDINGGMNLPYQPIGPMVSGGESLRISGNHNYSLMIGFKNDGSNDTLVAKKYMHDENGLESILSPYRLYIYNQNKEVIDQVDLDGFNISPGENQTTVAYASWNQNKEITPYVIGTTESSIFVVQQAEKALANTERDFYGRGIISSLESTTLGEGSFAILSNHQDVIDKLENGTYIRVQREFLEEFSGIKEITAGHGFILEDNQESPLLNESYYFTRAPRAIVGQKADGSVVMMTVDGRNAENNMYGVTQEEMAAICKYYGLVDAYNLDGGGSATFMVRSGDDFIVTNTPSDGNVRAISNAIFSSSYA